MSAAKKPIRLPFLPVSLAALLLLLSTGVLLFTFFDQTTAAERRLSSIELTDTVDQLSRVVTETNTQWVQSDQLARLVASTDVQIGDLVVSNDGVSGLLSPDENSEAVRQVSADWKLFREGLLSLSQAVSEAGNQSSQVEVQQPAGVTAPVEASSAPPVLATIPDSVMALATDFEPIRARVIEGTRVQQLIDLVNIASDGWAQVTSSNIDALPAIIERQKTYAAELLQLTKVGTEESLYGYYTTDRIVDYVQRLENVALPPAIIEGSAANTAKDSAKDSEITANELELSQAAAAGRAPLSSAFVTEALTSLQASVANLAGVSVPDGDERQLLTWLGLAGLAASLLLLLYTISEMMNVSDAVKIQPVAAELDAANTAVSTVVEAPFERVNRSAMSVTEAEQLDQNISLIGDGGLSHTVTVAGAGQAKALAESVDRSNSVVHGLVGVTQASASHLNGLVQKQDQHGRLLAEYDIRRQTEVAELCDSMGERAALLDDQQALLSNSAGLINEIDNRSETAVHGVNQVSASLAAVSAQVEVSSGRMQRVLKTAGSVSKATGRLQKLTEQTRLQALNISLKMPEAASEAVAESAYGFSDQYADPYAGQYAQKSIATGNDEVSILFDDIHQLTGKLVQIANETDTLIGALGRDIEETATALRQSSAEINESARHTMSTSLVGKELAGYSEQLREIVAEVSNNLESQKNELSQTAERIVRLDKSGNNTSQLMLALTQDIASLHSMSEELEDSVRGFKIHGEASLE